MILELFRLLVDFGLVVLIWIVQLVIYPGFRYYAKADLVRWHQIYTGRITLVVFPLMFVQLIIGAIQVWQGFDFLMLAEFVIILSLWGMTMVVFVPLHNKIASNEFENATLNSLISKNLVRTILWTFLFLVSLYRTF
ncbi:MAG: hypothetical protein AAF502_09530 [Bacteroidota bacterium]